MRTENRVIRLAVLSAIAAIASIAIAQPDDNAAARSLAASCTTCHGGAASDKSGDMPPLASVAKEDIVRKLNEFKTGTRPATVMHQLAKGYTGAQIEAIAAWFAAQKPAN